MTERGTGPDRDFRPNRGMTGGDAVNAEAAEEAEARESAEFETMLGAHLRSWDERIEPPVPHMIELEQLVSQRKAAMGRKVWRDLLLIWMLGILVIGGMLLVLDWNPVAFAVLQIAAVAGAVLFLTLTTRKDRRAKRRWTA